MKWELGRGETKPEAICRAGLLAKGVPNEIVKAMQVGPRMDFWVHCVIMLDVPVDLIATYEAEQFGKLLAVVDAARKCQLGCAYREIESLDRGDKEK